MFKGKLLLLIILNFAAIAGLASKPIKVGAEQLELYMKYIHNKRVGIVMNHTAQINNRFLLDTLLEKGVNVLTVFAPEHGFRGDLDAGEHVDSYTDKESGIKVVSLYGKNLKPSKEAMANIDILLFDIQDVGVRFYTYLSTLNNVMESCGKYNIPLIILDRPNPNGAHIDGPVLDTAKYKSFVGMNPIPILHGMTLGELGTMINEEGWLPNRVRCALKVIPCANYSHKMEYKLPIKPSPNLPNMRSIFLYPSLCLFEGTIVSVGRGTDSQFQIYGYPTYPSLDFQFTPSSKEGAKRPPYLGVLCQGKDLRDISISNLMKVGLDLTYLIDAYSNYKNKGDFFNPFFEKLVGSDELRKQIEAGWTVRQIQKSWEVDLDRFKQLRSRYLLYK